MKQLISEPITPVALSMSQVAGEPGIPTEFSWRNQTYRIERLLETWKGISADRTHGSSELYLHKHWYRFEASSGDIMTVYFDRQPKNRKPTARWWLYTIETSPNN